MNPADKASLAAERAALLRERWRSCDLCPRDCRVDRLAGERGYCGVGPDPVVYTAFLHHGEEPGISGSGGSGTIFFSGCNLKCVYCQNHRFSHSIEENRALTTPTGDAPTNVAGVGSVRKAAGSGPGRAAGKGGAEHRAGKAAAGGGEHGGRGGGGQTFEGERVSSRDLADVMLTLRRRGAENINFVTSTHFLPPVMESLSMAFREVLGLPLVYNTSGYEKAETIDILDGIVDIYLADLRYVTPEAAERYSNAPDYPAVNREALLRMYRQRRARWEGELLKEGLVVRHLVLPGYVEESKRALRWVAENTPGAVISLMFQYQPYFRAGLYPEINRRVNEEEYHRVRDFLEGLELEGWCQELSPEEGLAGIHFRPSLEGLL